MAENSTQKSSWKHKYRSLKRQEDRLEFEEWSDDDFINHIFELREEFNTLQKKYDLLKAKPKQETDSPVATEKKLKLDDFKAEWPYSTKFVFLLSLENRPLKSIEIHTHLLKLDSKYKSFMDTKATLSVYLRRVVKSGRIKAVKISGIQEKFFVMPEWVDVNGRLNSEFDCIFGLF